MPEQERDWSVRAFQSGDAPQVAVLYEEIYQRPLDPAYYRWKLHTQEAGSGVSNVWVAGRRQELVGHYGGTPRRFWLQGRTLPARHTSDAMTSPHYRKQGIYSAVGATAHAAWTAAGEPFLFGLPNDKWGSRVAYLNYRRMFPAIWLRRPLQPQQLLANRFALPSQIFRPANSIGRRAQAYWNRPLKRTAAGVEVTAVVQPGTEFNELWQRLRSAYEALVVRDLAWVRYRYLNVPGCDYHLLFAQRKAQPVGYLAYRVTTGANGPVGWIMDIFTAPDDTAARAALLLSAVADLLTAGAGSARVLLPPGTPLYEQIRQAGFSPAAGEFGCHIVPLAWPDPPAVFSDPNRWFTMAGDYDIF